MQAISSYTNIALPTPDDVVDMVTGRKSGVVRTAPNCRLLKYDLSPYTLLSPDDPSDPSSIRHYVSDISVEMNTSNEVHRQATFTLREFPGIKDFNTLLDCMMVSVEYYSEDGSVVLDVPVGIFGFTIPDRLLSDGNNTWSITGYDLTQRVTRLGFLNTYTIPQGVNVVEAVKTLLMMDFLPPIKGGRVPSGVVRPGTTQSGLPVYNSTDGYCISGYALEDPRSGAYDSELGYWLHPASLLWSNPPHYSTTVGTKIVASGVPIDPTTCFPMSVVVVTEGGIDNTYFETANSYYYDPSNGDFTIATPLHSPQQCYNPKTNAPVTSGAALLNAFGGAGNPVLVPPGLSVPPTAYTAVGTPAESVMTADSTGYLISGITGERFNPYGGIRVDASTHYPLDPWTELPMTPLVNMGYARKGFAVTNPNSRCYLSGSNYLHPATAAQPNNNIYNPSVGTLVDGTTGVPIDPTNGALMQVVTKPVSGVINYFYRTANGYYYDVGTGIFTKTSDAGDTTAYDPLNGQLYIGSSFVLLVIGGTPGRISEYYITSQSYYFNTTMGEFTNTFGGGIINAIPMDPFKGTKLPVGFAYKYPLPGTPLGYFAGPPAPLATWPFDYDGSGPYFAANPLPQPPNPYDYTGYSLGLPLCHPPDCPGVVPVTMGPDTGYKFTTTTDHGVDMPSGTTLFYDPNIWVYPDNPPVPLDPRTGHFCVLTGVNPHGAFLTDAGDLYDQSDGLVYDITHTNVVSYGRVNIGTGAGAITIVPVVTGTVVPWPDSNNPGETPSGCDDIGPNFAPERIIIPPSDQLLLVPMQFTVQDNKLSAINQLLTSINYWPLWADEFGNMRSSPIYYATGVAPPVDYTFSTGNNPDDDGTNGSFIFPPVAIKINDQTSLGNVVNIRSENNSAKPISATAYNEGDTSMLSINILKYILMINIQDDAIIDPSILALRAAVELEYAALGQESAELETQLWPFAQAHDVYTLNVWNVDGTLEVGDNPNPFIVQSWSIDFSTRRTHWVMARYVPL